MRSDASSCQVAGRVRSAIQMNAIWRMRKRVGCCLGTSLVSRPRSELEIHLRRRHTCYRRLQSLERSVDTGTMRRDSNERNLGRVRSEKRGWISVERVLYLLMDQVSLRSAGAGEMPQLAETTNLCAECKRALDCQIGACETMECRNAVYKSVMLQNAACCGFLQEIESGRPDDFRDFSAAKKHTCSGVIAFK